MQLAAMMAQPSIQESRLAKLRAKLEDTTHTAEWEHMKDDYRYQSVMRFRRTRREQHVIPLDYAVRLYTIVGNGFRGKVRTAFKGDVGNPSIDQVSLFWENIFRIDPVTQEAGVRTIIGINRYYSYDGGMSLTIDGEPRIELLYRSGEVQTQYVYSPLTNTFEINSDCGFEWGDRDREPISVHDYYDVLEGIVGIIPPVTMDMQFSYVK